MSETLKKPAGAVFFRSLEGAPIVAAGASWKSGRRFRFILTVIWITDLALYLANIWGSLSGAFSTSTALLIADIAIVIPVSFLGAILVAEDAKRRGRRAFAWAVLTYFGALLAIPAYLNGIREEVAPPTPSYVSPVHPINPDGLACPYCRSQDLVVAKDRSAYCLACKRGILPTRFGEPTA